MHNSDNHQIVITMGDPTGIGPYIIQQLNFAEIKNARVILIGDKNKFPKLLKKNNFHLLDFPLAAWDGKPRTIAAQKKNLFSRNISIETLEKIKKSQFTFFHLSQMQGGRESQQKEKWRNFSYSKPSPHSGYYSYMCFYLALEFIGSQAPHEIQKVRLITGPVSKEWILKAGINFFGHTEELSKRFSRPVLMLLTTAGMIKTGIKNRTGNKNQKHPMSVIPLTGHIPLRKVALALKKIKLGDAITVIKQNKKYLGITVRSPLAVLSLNPHGGEGGRVGDEEIHTIQPMIKKLNLEGLPCHGPFAADGFFGSENWKKYSVTLGVYHDQVLTPFKFHTGSSGINITLGLPFKRFSPDHGPAFDLPKIEHASSESMKNCLLMAAARTTATKAKK